MSKTEDQIWAAEVLQRIQEKYSVITDRNPKDFFPYTVEQGRFRESKYEHDYEWWTNGFYPGILWKLYLMSKNEKYRTLAEDYESMLDIPLNHFEGLHHDAGFMWLTSAVADYRITQNSRSRMRGLHAASVLASRFNIRGNFIRAWNGEENGGWAIIDSMMNIPILYWASRELKDPRFYYIAKSHADKVMDHFIREDGSVRHIVSFDLQDGNFIEEMGGQGFQKGSAWTRGQAWAIYGFLLSYLHTGDEKYLNASKKTAHYFLAALSLERDYVLPCDFRAPEKPVYKDTTAGAIAACGLWEIGKAVPEEERGLYQKCAVKILRSIEKNYCSWDMNKDGIVICGTERYGEGTNIPIIYGDYYFIEALMKIAESDVLFW